MEEEGPPYYFHRLDRCCQRFLAAIFIAVSIRVCIVWISSCVFLINQFTGIRFNAIKKTITITVRTLRIVFPCWLGYISTVLVSTASLKPSPSVSALVGSVLVSSYSSRSVIYHRQSPCSCSWSRACTISIQIFQIIDKFFLVEVRSRLHPNHHPFFLSG